MLIYMLLLLSVPLILDFQLNLTSWSVQYLSSLFLKAFTDSALTTVSGRLFHTIVTLLEKENLQKILEPLWKNWPVKQKNESVLLTYLCVLFCLCTLWLVFVSVCFSLCVCVFVCVFMCLCVCCVDAIRWTAVSHKTSSHSARADRSVPYRLRRQRNGSRLQQTKKSARILCCFDTSFGSAVIFNVYFLVLSSMLEILLLVPFLSVIQFQYCNIFRKRNRKPNNILKQPKISKTNTVQF